jgi:hypothetical protein
MMPLDLEGLATEKMRLWDSEVSHRKLLSQIPHQLPFWVRWLGDGMVLVGNRLTCWGGWRGVSTAKKSLLPVNDRQ